MPKQINVDLHITADTTRAKQNLNNLFISLKEISNYTPNFGMAMENDIAKAVASAKELQYHLTNAMDVKTGNLNLDKLEMSLKKSGQSLNNLTADLLKAGPVGEQSFLTLQRSISSAGVKLSQTQGLLSNFLITLKNTARWQLSSTLVHGIVGALQGSISYAKDLNESLNNIRIVTQRSTEQMAEFAEKANKAAQALSTTTTSYTDAALIYYQQGLDDKEVEARTEVTIKMANATGKSAREVSQQLTAVWNNFADGSKNLEHYADVMTALGASTASSTDEIAQGLEKFAAIANTVGLSYEYAASALATVTATTRQSADVVGTAFKTLFARIQDLELGKTLDDGTTLGKYSEALATIGVNIKNTSGQMKDMNTILNEMGEKWQTLSKDTQVAVAQAVGGTRQYTQLIALMDNWDFMQQNLEVANNSDGTLQAQADVYAESWEASSKRVKAALEELYNDLIPTDFIIKMNDGFAKVVNLVDSLVQSFGGLPNILLLISSILLTKFAPTISQSVNIGIEKVTMLFSTISTKIGEGQAKIQGFFSSIKELFASIQDESFSAKGVFENIAKSIMNASSAASESQKFLRIFDEIATTGVSTKAQAKKSGISQQEIYEKNFAPKEMSFQREATNTLFNSVDNHKFSSEGARQEVETQTQINNITSLILQNRKLLTKEQQDQLKQQTDELSILAKERAEEQNKLDILKEEKSQLAAMSTERVYADTGGPILTNDDKTLEMKAEGTFSTGELSEANALLDQLNAKQEVNFSLNQGTNGAVTLVGQRIADNVSLEDTFIQLQQDSLIHYQSIIEANESIKMIMGDELATEDQKRAKIAEQINLLETSGAITKETANQLREILNSGGSTVDKASAFNKLMGKTIFYAKGTAKAFGNSAEAIKKAESNAKNLVKQQNKLDKATNKYVSALNGIRKKIKEISNQKLDIGSSITGAIQGLSQIGMGISAVANSWKTLTSEDASFFEKVSAGAIGLTMALRAVDGATKFFNSSMQMVAPLADKLSQSLLKKKSAVMEGAAADQEAAAAAAAKSGAEQAAAEATAIGSGADQEAAAAAELKSKADLNQATSSQIAAGAQSTENSVKASSIPVLNTEAIETTIVTGAKTAEGTAHIENAGAILAEEAAAAPLLLIVLAIIAALAILVVAIVAITNAINADTKALEESNKAVQEAKEAYDSLKESYENFKSTLSDYKDAIDGMDNLTKGTKAFEEQIKAANEAARTLIDQYDELEGKYHYNAETGLIEFDKGALEDLDKFQNEKVKRGEESYLLTKNANLQLKNDQAIKSASQKDDIAALGKNIATEIGLVMAARLNPIFATLSVMNPILGYKENNIRNQQQQDALNKFAEISERYPDIALKSAAQMGLLTQKEESLIQELGLNESALHELILSINNNTDAMLQNTKKIVDEHLTGANKGYDNSQNKDQLNTLLAKNLQSKTDEIYEKAYKDRFGGLNDKTVQQLYAKEMGYTWVSNESDNNGKYQDKEGNEITISDETARLYLAQQKALVEMDSIVGEMNSAVSKLSQSDSAIQQALLASITGGSAADIKMSGIEKKSYSVEELQGNLSDEEFDIIWRTQGFKSAEEFADSFNTELQEKYKSFEEVLSTVTVKMSETTSDNLREIMGEMYSSEAQQMAQALNNLFEEFDNSAVNNLIDSTSELMSELSKEDQEKLQHALGQISDYTDASQWDELAKSMKNSNTLTKEQEEVLNKYIKKVKQAVNATKKIDFGKLENDLRTLRNTIKDVSEGKRDFTDEEYAALTEAGISADSFCKTLDGYKYLGDTEDLILEMQDAAKEKLEDTAFNLQQLSEEALRASENVSKSSAAYRDARDNANREIKELTESEKLRLTIIEKIKQAIEGIREKLQAIKGFFTELYNNILVPMFEGISEAINNAYDIIVTAINNVTNVIAGFINKLLGTDIKGTELRTSDEIATDEKKEEDMEALAEATAALKQSTTEQIESIEATAQEMSAEDLQAAQNDNQKNIDAVDTQLEQVREQYEAADEEMASYYEKQIGYLEEQKAALEEVDAAYSKALQSKGYGVTNSTQAMDYGDDPEAYGAALTTLAKKYESCKKELIDYNKAVKENGINSQDAKNAAKALAKAIKDAEWNKLTKSVKASVEALKNITDIEERANEFKKIADAINETFDTKVTSAWVEDNMDLIDEWYNSSGEEAQKIALKIEQLSKAASMTEEQINSIEIDETVYQGIAGGYEELKGIIENNPITINANGRADLSNLITSLLEAGASAEWVANYLASIGQTDVQLEGIGEKIKAYDLNSAEGIAEFVESLSGWNGSIRATSYSVPSEGVADMTHGGGGGGGGGSEKKEKNISDEKDRYHEVTKKLDDLGRAYDRLGKHKDQAFGKSYIDIIKKETEALDEQINTLNSKLKEAEGYYKKDLAAIQQYGAIVDENGNITNYNAIIEKYVGLFNAGSIDEDAYSEMKEALDRFEETADILEDIKNEIEDKVYEKIALEIERIDTEVNMKIEISDEDLRQLEYLLTKIENQSFNTAKQIAIMGYQTDEVFSKINTYGAGLKSLEEQAAQNLANGLFTETGGWDSDMKDKAKEFTDGLMEANETLLEYKQTLTEKFQEAIDEVNETFDNQIGRFDNYTSILESYVEILHLTGKTLKNSDLIIKFGNQQVEVARNQLIALKAQQNTLYASLADAQQKLADAQARGDQDAIRHWTDEINNITIQAEEGKANLISSFQEAMSTAADIFASTVEQFSAQAEAALSIYDSLDDAQAAFEKAQEREEWYLSKSNQAYELSKLMRNINQQIDKTNNLGAQIKLRDIMDEIRDIQKNNVQLSQDDLDILNAKYQLRLAEIALEEAQNAKDTVKLSRNAEGGWGYIYTANQDAADDAMQNYEDKAHELEEKIKEALDNISSSILENKKSMIDEIAGLNRESFENEEEYQKRVAEITQYYLDKDAYLREQFAKRLADSNLNYGDTLLGQVEGAESLEAGRQIMEDTVQSYLDNISEAFAEYQKQINGILGSLGFDNVEDLLSWLQSSANDIVDGANGLSSKLMEYSEESQKAIKEAADAIANYEKQYNESINSMIGTSENMIKTVTEMLRRFGLLDNNATLADFWGEDIVNDSSIPTQFDTGGYTGEWGRAGKLAVLHEKELVLNKNETEDLLKIMDIMKDRALQNKLNSMEKYLNATQQIIDNLFKKGTNNLLEQNVHITAEFPNVTDHNEIEEAFNNLINSASQYINRY